MNTEIYIPGLNWAARVSGPFIVIGAVDKTSFLSLIEIKLLSSQYKNFISCNPDVNKKSHACIRTSTLNNAVKITDIMDLIKYRLCK